MSNKKYTVLTCQTEYSLLHSMNRCKNLEKKLDNLGLDSCALTDYGSVSGAVDFSTNIGKRKSILGCKLNITNGNSQGKGEDNKVHYHQTVLAKNKYGWKNLLKLVSKSNEKGRFSDGETRLSLNDMGNNLKHIIGMTGSITSGLANRIIQDGKIIPDYKVIGSRYVSGLSEMFDKGNFFIQVEAITSEISPIYQHLVEAVRDIAQYVDIPIIATPNPHYCDSKDQIDHHVLLAGSLNKSIEEAKELKPEFAPFFNSDQFHIPSYDEMLKCHTEEELSNTNVVSDMCSDYKITRDPNPPEFICPNNMSSEAYLRQICLEGWNEKVKPILNDHPELKEVYAERAKFELGVFKEYNLSSYFLIVRDLLKFCTNKGYLVGPGRGCFLPDTRVKMSDGQYTPISLIEKGDKVIDAFGEEQIVYDTLEYDVDEELLELEFENGKIIRCTKDHKFLTHNRGWVEAQHLTEDDDVAEIT